MVVRSPSTNGFYSHMALWNCERAKVTDKEILDSIEDLLVNNFEEEFSYSSDEMKELLNEICSLIERRKAVN